jgi:hypothetical protein
MSVLGGKRTLRLEGTKDEPVPLPRVRAFARHHKEKTMIMPRIPGNEPDPGDMSTDTATEAPDHDTNKHDLPHDEAEKLGNFA